MLYVGCMAKTHIVHDPSTAVTGFYVKSLVAILHRSQPDRSICPVRMLQFYLSRTDHHRAERRPLLLPLRETASRKLSPNMTLAWLKKTISLAYEVTKKDEVLGCLHSLWAHKTRAFTASWDALWSVSVGDIMAACRWRSHNTSSSFYLRDLIGMEAQPLALKYLAQQLLPTCHTCRMLVPSPPAS